MTCPLCNGRGFSTKTEGIYEIVVACSCQRMKQIHAELGASGIPQKYQQYSLLDAPADGRIPFKEAEGFYARGLSEGDALELRHCKMSQKKALAICRERYETYLKAFQTEDESIPTPGFMLRGPCGTGKTHMAATLLTDLVYAGVSPVRFVEYTQLFRQLRYSYGSSELRESDILEPLVKAKVLCLDDLGAQASDNTTWVQDILGYLLNERYGSMLPTIITTNFPDELDEGASGPFLSDRLGVRLRSRIREMCPAVHMTGLDLRQLMDSAKNKGKPG